jgi:nucleoside-diphosphate-sugar epimerase
MSTTNQSKDGPKKVLITGASGLLGVAAIERFLDAGWDVVGVSRRKPELPSGRNIDFLSVDLRDQEKTRAAFEPLTDVTHIAYTALHEKPELVAGWSSKGQSIPIMPCCAMWWSRSSAPAPIASTSASFKGRRSTACTCTQFRSRPRERDARKDHPNFFFDQEAYVGEMGAKHDFSYTALRPQLVTGPTPGALNVLTAIGAYAAIRREKGEPFGFPGGPSFVWEAADADLVADVMIWAAQSPQAANEAFNITNGDVFEWRNVWPGIAETLGVKTGPDTPTSVTTYLAENAEIWDKIVAKYGLRSRSLRELVGQGDQHADFAFAYGARWDRGPSRVPSSCARRASQRLSIPRCRSVTRCSL